MTIPHRMAFFWDGPMSWLRWLTLHSFRRLNPDWEMRLYSCGTSRRRTWGSGERMDCEWPGGVDYRGRVAELGVQQHTVELPLADLSPAHASDLFSYRYLGTDGGWYADLDILWVQPMESMRGAVQDANAVLARVMDIPAVGFLGGTPDCAFWQHAYRTALTSHDPSNYQSCGAEVLYHTAHANVPGSRVVEVPSVTVYPFWPTARGMAQLWREVVCLPPECIGIHWFGGHPDSQAWNRRLTVDSFDRSGNRNTITSHIVTA